MPPFQPNHKVMDAFIRWIEQSSFDPQHAKNWAHLYVSNPEAAMCEATFWAVLSDCGMTVCPNADLTGRSRSPDFLCCRDGAKFYVEATCVRMDTATDHTKLTHLPKGGGSWYRPLNDAIYSEIGPKTKQCANLDAPCLVAIGTFHFQASAIAVRKPFIEQLLTGELSMSCRFDCDRGQTVGEAFLSTSLKSATFVRPSQLAGVAPARQPISGILVGGFGCDPPRVLGALHPTPVRPFDPALLDRIPFCRQKIDLRAGKVSTEWVQTPDGWTDC